MKNTVLSLTAILFVFPIAAVAANIHGVEVPNECLASLRVKPNAFISNFSSFSSSWKSHFQGHSCETVEKIRENLFIDGATKTASEIKFILQGTQLRLEDLEKWKKEIESDLATSKSPTDVAKDVTTDIVMTQYGTISTIIGCFPPNLGCAMDVVGLFLDIKDLGDNIIEGQNALNTSNKFKERIEEIGDKIKKAQNELGLLEKLSSDQIEKGAKQATKDFVEMCQLVKLNCK